MTHLEAIIMGLLRSKSLTGYEVLKVLAHSPAYGVRSTAGSVYPALKRLQKAGFIEAKDASQGNRAANNYGLTTAGRASFDAWLKGPIRFGDTAATEDLLLRVLFSDHLSRRDLEETIAAYRDAAVSQVLEIESLRPDWGNLPLNQRLCLENGLLASQAQLDWADRALVELKERKAKTKG